MSIDIMNSIPYPNASHRHVSQCTSYILIVMMKKLILFISIVVSVSCAAQKELAVSTKEVLRIESVLAADDMRGRRAGTPDIDRAAAFISDEFRKAGLQPLNGNSFLQEFVMIRPRVTQIKGEMDGQELSAGSVVVVAMEEEIKVDEKSGYQKHYISKGEMLRNRAMEITSKKEPAIVFVDTSFARNFSRLGSLNGPVFKNSQEKQVPVIYILGHFQPKEFKIKAEIKMEETRFANVVGQIPGRDKKNEFVVFSGHYDHLGVKAQPVNGDSIYNGANDDASGTTAVIMLAQHFAKQRNNERTLLFVAFTAEEMGGFGSRYFSQQLDPARVMTMFNIEMIGTESRWGKNSAYITGFEKSDMGTILQKNLKGSSFQFMPDPYTKENLFYRSDNATLARLGVPAHTIATAKMEGEPNYHQLTDEVSTLDLDNMAKIIEAIALSSATIIKGIDTPSRVKPESLQ